MVSVNCPCNAAPTLVRLCSKTFSELINEIKTCSCKFLSASGRVDRGDKWTEVSTDIVSSEQLGASVCGVISVFHFKYLELKCAPEEPAVPSTSRPPTAFAILLNAQQRTHLPPPKVAQNKKDELRNDITANLRTRGVGFSRDECTNQGSYLLTVSDEVIAS